MKRKTAVFMAFLASAGILAGVSGQEKEQEILAAGQEETQAESEAAAEDAALEEAQEPENPDVPEIDTAVPIQAGTHIAVVSKNTKGSYWKQIHQGMKDAVRDVNVAYGFEKEEQVSMTFEGPDDETDVETQINTLDAVLSENPDVLCLSAGDMNSCQAQLETAMENGIPVVAFDSNVSESELVAAYCGTDNIQLGKMAAEKLVQAIGEKGKIAVLSVQEKTQSIQERILGFTEEIAKYPDIEIVEMVYQDEVKDMNAAIQGVLTLHPTLAGIFCSNADMADLYLNLEKAERSPTPVLVGVDGMKRQQEAVLAGEELGIVSQNPYAIGYQTIWAALRVSVEELPEEDKNVILEPVWIDAENIENPAFDSYIY